MVPIRRRRSQAENRMGATSLLWWCWFLPLALYVGLTAFLLLSKKNSHHHIGREHDASRLVLAGSRERDTATTIALLEPSPAEDPPRKKKQDDDDVTTPLITVIVPAYECSSFAEQLMETLRQQTIAPSLRVIFSIDQSSDADQTEAILNRHQSDLVARTSKNRMDVHIHRQQHRLHFSGNYNFLLKQIQSRYYSFLGCDDTLPSDYYEKLAQCLNENPQAINCYPYVVRINESRFRRNRTERQESVVGPVHQRVSQVIQGKHWIPFRGLVRRPATGPFPMPRLHKIYTSADVVLMVQQAIAGEFIEVDVPYYKFDHMKSIHHTQLYNASAFFSGRFEGCYAGRVFTKV